MSHNLLNIQVHSFYQIPVLNLDTVESKCLSQLLKQMSRLLDKN